MLCFAYGSNMSLQRLRARVPSARFVAVATLPEHRLMFHKRSREDGSAKCNAFYTGDTADRVVGVVYDIAETQKRDLDRVEGLGYGYDETIVAVTTREGETLNAQMYAATDMDDALLPYSWYRWHVLVGARENAFPRGYIGMIEQTPVQEDPDRARHDGELAVYAAGADRMSGGRA